MKGIHIETAIPDCDWAQRDVKMSKKAVLIVFTIFCVFCSLLYWTLTRKPEPEVTYSLVEAVEQGIVNAQFSGTGYCSGDSIGLWIGSKVEYGLKIEIEPGWVLINSGAGQNMIIAEERTITLKPKAELGVTIEAYCLDIDRDNPSTFETLSLQNNTGNYRTEVVELMKSFKSAPELRRSLSAVQIALWTLLGDITSDDITIRYSEDDIIDAKWLLENIGVDVNEKEIIREIFERPTLAVEITQYSVSEKDGYIHIIGEVKNTGNQRLTLIEVRAMFFDSSDTALGTAKAGALRPCLLPGEVAPFHMRIWKSPDRYANLTRHDIWPSYAGSTMYIPYREYRVLDPTVEEKDGNFHATGEIRNTGGEYTRPPKIVVSIYDRTGKIIGCGHYVCIERAETYSFEIEETLLGIIDHWEFYVEEMIGYVRE